MRDALATTPRPTVPWDLHALTFYQPEATLVALGEKRIDTRSWGSDYRGWLAIHAAKQTPCEHLARAATTPYAHALARHALRDLPSGAIVALAYLRDVVPLAADDWRELVLNHGGQFEYAFGDYAPGRRAWLLGPVVPLDPPVPASGGRGLWHWTPNADVRERVRALLDAELRRGAAAYLRAAVRP